MHERQGDLLQLALDGEFDVIVHGCNCFGDMGKGIALAVKQQFSEAYQADCATVKGDRAKLGTFSSALVQRGGGVFVVVNAYTQFDWRGRGVKVDYAAIGSVFAQIQQRFTGQRIGYPLIGAGLAGGDWDVIAPIIDQALVGERHTLVRFAVGGG